jgi:hypothetical protein
LTRANTKERSCGTLRKAKALDGGGVLSGGHRSPAL